MFSLVYKMYAYLCIYVKNLFVCVCHENREVNMRGEDIMWQRGENSNRTEQLGREEDKKTGGGIWERTVAVRTKGTEVWMKMS